DEAIFSLVPVPKDAVEFFEQKGADEDTQSAWSATWASAQTGRYPLPAAPSVPPVYDDLYPQQSSMSLMLPGIAYGAAPPAAMAPPLPFRPMPMPAEKSAGFSLPTLPSFGGGDELEVRAAFNAPPFTEGSAPQAEPLQLRSDFSPEAAFSPAVVLTGSKPAS